MQATKAALEYIAQTENCIQTRVHNAVRPTHGGYLNLSLYMLKYAD